LKKRKIEEEKERVSKSKDSKRRIVERDNSLEKIDIQKEIIVEALLDNGATNLVISSEFAKK